MTITFAAAAAARADIACVYGLDVWLPSCVCSSQLVHDKNVTFVWLYWMRTWTANIVSSIALLPFSVSESCTRIVNWGIHLSPRLCPSTAGCIPPSMPSFVLCLLLSCSSWFLPSLLCRLAIFCLVISLISSLSLVATLCSVWSTYCPSFLLYVQPISIFVSICVL